MHNFKYNFLPESFNSTWITNRIRRADQSEIELRDDDLFYVPFTRSSTLCKLPMVSFPKIWNEFEAEDVKFIRNKIEFNLKLKNYFFSNLSSIPQCTRLFCPSCAL
jgi:hypothetical protein